MNFEKRRTLIVLFGALHTPVPTHSFIHFTWNTLIETAGSFNQTELALVLVVPLSFSHFAQYTHLPSYKINQKRIHRFASHVHCRKADEEGHTLLTDTAPPPP